MRVAAVVGALIFAAANSSPAMADIVDLKWNEGAFAHKSTIAPKKFLEVCGTLKKGEAVAWLFSAAASTDFNIHYHVGKDVVYPEQRKGVSEEAGTLTVPLDQDFCWMWSNRSDAPIAINIRLKRAVNK